MWVPFDVGNNIIVHLHINDLGSGPFEIGRVLVSYATLRNALGGAVEFKVAQGLVAFRLVDTAITNAVPSNTPPVALGVLNMTLFSTQQSNFPPLSFRCSVSAASFPSYNNAFDDQQLNGTTNFYVSLSGAVTAYDTNQAVARLAGYWLPPSLGPILVCSVYADNSLQGGVWQTPDRGLGAFTLRSSAVSVENASYSPSSAAYSVGLGACPTCAVYSLGSQPLCLMGMLLLLLTLFLIV